MNEVKAVLDEVVLHQIKKEKPSLPNLRLNAENKQFAAVPYRSARLMLSIIKCEVHRNYNPKHYPENKLYIELIECDRYGERLSFWRSTDEFHKGESIDLSLPFEQIFGSYRRFHQISIRSNLPNHCPRAYYEANVLNDALVSAAMKANEKYGGKLIEVRRIRFSILRFSLTFPFGDQRSFLSLISPSTLRYLAIDDSGKNDCWTSVVGYSMKGLDYYRYACEDRDLDSIDHSHRSLGDALAKFENLKALVILQLYGHLAGTALSGYLKSLPSVQKLCLSSTIENVARQWFSETFPADGCYQLKKLCIRCCADRESVPWIALLAEPSATDFIGHLEAVNVHGKFRLFDSFDNLSAYLRSMAHLRSIFARLPPEARLCCYDYTGFIYERYEPEARCVTMLNGQRVADGLRSVLLVGSNGSKGSLFEMSIRIDQRLIEKSDWKTSFIHYLDRALGILRIENQRKFGTLNVAFDDEIDVRPLPTASLKFGNVSITFSFQQPQAAQPRLSY